MSERGIMGVSCKGGWGITNDVRGTEVPEGNPIVFFKDQYHPRYTMYIQWVILTGDHTSRISSYKSTNFFFFLRFRKSLKWGNNKKQYDFEQLLKYVYIDKIRSLIYSSCGTQNMITTFIANSTVQ